jgi:WD40 repeat protein
MEVKGDTDMSLRLVHRTSSSVGQNICGGYFDAQTHDLMLYGFRAQDFVLRNESKQVDIISIPSGGFRRKWVFQPGITGTRDALFLWREGTALKKVRIRADINRSLRAGGHGREIRALDAFNPTNGHQQLFATGAEDTLVRIFRPSASAKASPWGSLESLRVLNTHKAGLQQVTWSKDGRYLFTSAAYEEFFVWRVRSIPSFGVGTMLMAVSPKDDPNSDLRITSFDVLDVECENKNHGFLICLALSNSTLKASSLPLSDHNG